jgi:hypothetical protein
MGQQLPQSDRSQETMAQLGIKAPERIIQGTDAIVVRQKEQRGGGDYFGKRSQIKPRLTLHRAVLREYGCSPVGPLPEELSVPGNAEHGARDGPLLDGLA